MLIDAGSRGHNRETTFHATCTMRGTPTHGSIYSSLYPSSALQKTRRTHIWAIRCDIGLLRGWLVVLLAPSGAPFGTKWCTVAMFGFPPRTFCLLRSIHLPPSIPQASVFSISLSLASRDGFIHAWCRGLCVRHSKLWCIRATKHDLVSYWTNNKDNQTQQSA